MGPTRVKICGITREEDARIVAGAGADAIGLVFYEPSTRAVSPERAAAIAATVPPFVTIVGLFVDASAQEIESVLRQVPLGLIQFHGKETPEFCARFDRPWVKALRMKPGVDLAFASSRYHQSQGLLLDTWRENVPGGTGETFDWSLASTAVASPLILAGGLNDTNVGEAIRTLNPAAVDVCGGVESSPGVKDTGKVHRFMAAVRAAHTQ